MSFFFIFYFMKYLFYFLFLSSCNYFGNNQAKNPTTIKITLAKDLPFSEIKLNQFNVLYGGYDPLEYQSSKSKDTFVFKINIDTFSTIDISDKNNIGVKAIYLEPGDNFTAEIFWGNNGPNLRIYESEYPGNNLFYESIRDSINAIRIKLENTSLNFQNRNDLSDYVDQAFEQIVGPAKVHFSNLKMSKYYVDHILNPLLDLNKSNLKNELIKKLGKENIWADYYSDAVFKTPNFKTWSTTEYYSFPSYLFGRVNNKEISTIENFVQNVQDFYHVGKDTLQSKILVSNAITAFSNYQKLSKESPNKISHFLDSICQLYHLDKNKYGFSASAQESSLIISKTAFENIFLMSLPQKNKVTADLVFKDTSQIYYVDYWASWCQPCIKSLPFSIALSKKEISNFKVLFISIDKENKDFIIAAKKYGLPPTQTFNLINDDKNNENYKKLNARESIPQYQLIYFYQHEWHISYTTSADDDSLLKEINELKTLLKK